ncbi:MAG: 5'-methylthioadenosine/adenosylhomocysteine nucleosidase [Clostridia bacterium]|nr:5'-methylthioadenosine/adenosylhomocysteine nucleosidase [Clostridia bacterium]
MKKVGIVVAMQEEFNAVERKIKEPSVKEIHKLKFIIGKIGKTTCILVRCGVGKVHAARTTQILIDNFNVDKIINVGSAGCINEKYNIGDVIIGRRAVQHDFDITAFDHSKGYIPGVGNEVRCEKESVDEIEKVILNRPDKNYNIGFGTVATGDIFCTDNDMKNKIRIKFDADIVDMECGAIAQVAFLEDIPFIVIRSISDCPNGKNATDFDKNLKLASKRSANVLEDFLNV